jgi:predicted lipoprotein
VTKRALLLLPVLLLGCKIATIRPIESEDEAPGPQEFDAATHVDGLWSEDVPVALDQAVDLRDLLPAFAADPARARETWGRREGSGPFHVIVRGTGRVTGVDTSSRTGIAEVDVEVPSGTAATHLQVGPVLRGTSIRDALPTVSFDQFVNQIQFADVANELNARAEREVLGDLEREALAGKTVRFVGMATLGEPPLTVTPVRLTVEGGP